jgi:hypothetical protein
LSGRSKLHGVADRVIDAAAAAPVQIDDSMQRQVDVEMMEISGVARAVSCVDSGESGRRVRE